MDQQAIWHIYINIFSITFIRADIQMAGAMFNHKALAVRIGISSSIQDFSHVEMNFCRNVLLSTSSSSPQTQLMWLPFASLVFQYSIHRHCRLSRVRYYTHAYGKHYRTMYIKRRNDLIQRHSAVNVESFVHATCNIEM